MKKLILLLVISMLLSCSSTRLIESWKNPQSQPFHPEKLLVVGMTEHINARSMFEQELQTQLSQRKINTVKSLDIFSPEFTHAKQTSEDIAALVKMLKTKGFDAVMVTAVRGVEQKKVVRKRYDNFYARRFPFRDYYFVHQEIYYHPEYDEIFKIYHVETSLYDINSEDERSLIWVGYIDVVDPTSVTTTVSDYVSQIIAALEKERVIQKM